MGVRYRDLPQHFQWMSQSVSQYNVAQVVLYLKEYCNWQNIGDNLLWNKFSSCRFYEVCRVSLKPFVRSYDKWVSDFPVCHSTQASEPCEHWTHNLIGFFAEYEPDSLWHQRVNKWKFTKHYDCILRGLMLFMLASESTKTARYF